MKVLVIGSGAREHALVRALDADCAVDEVLAAPGNPGIADLARCEPLADVTDAAAVLDLAARHTVDLVVIGPEAPLVAGVADVLRDEGYAVFGPSAQAARLEGSKSFAKEVMAAAGVPTALAHVCTTEAEVAAAVDGFGTPHVVKDDGLAAGKGVIVTDDREAALAHARACLAKEGGRVVVEEYLDGPEVSVFCVTDGETVLALAPAQDFKRVGDGDCGPNTGGMGAYSPLPWAPSRARPTRSSPALPSRPSTRCIGGVCRSSAPSTSGWRSPLGGCASSSSTPGSATPTGRSPWPGWSRPLGGLLMAAATGRLDEYDLAAPASRVGRRRRPCGAGLSGGAADRRPAPGLEQAAEVDGAYLLHAGTRRTDSGALVSAGGRVLDVVALGADLATARDTAYRAVKHLGLAGSHYRSDIALRAVRGDIRLGEESR